MNKITNWFTICTLILLPLSTYAQVNADAALSQLKDGNKRFYEGQMKHSNQDLQTIKELTNGQHPFAVIVSCSDSRVSPDIVFDQGLGEIFSIRTAGNVMGNYEEGSIEYAVEHLGTQLVVVMGHTSCGAVKAYIDLHQEADGKHDSHHNNKPMGHIRYIVKKLESEQEEKTAAKDKSGNYYERAVEANVINGVKQLRNSKPILSEMNKENKIKVVGAIYHLDTGVVEFLDI